MTTDTRFEQVQGYVDRAITLFEVDPPDTDFQRGFLEALTVLRREALQLQTEERP